MGLARNFILILLSFVLGSQAFASNAPLSVSLLPPVQYPAEDYSITGIRIGLLWGNQAEVNGIDFGGLGNITQTSFKGAAVSGGFNLNHGTTDIYLFQFAGLANINMGATNVYGIQLTAGVNSNNGTATIYGVQLAPVNIGKQTNIYGLQMGIYNSADSVYGFQIGLINVAKNLHGLQIGFLNFNETGFFQVAPFLNFGF